MRLLPNGITAAALAACVSVHAGAVQASDAAGKITIEDAWARATIGATANGAAYFTANNAGERADAIVAADSPVAARVELHTHTVEDGMMRMHEVERVEVAPGEPTKFEPGGLHVMLIDLEAPLMEGETFPLTLEFADAGMVAVDVEVKPVTHDPGAEGQGHNHDHDHGH